MRQLLVFLTVAALPASSQTLGGNTVFSFLNQPAGPQVTGLGGMNISTPGKDLSLAYHTPSLLVPSMDKQLNAVFNSHYAGIKMFHLSYAMQHHASATTFSGGIRFFDYGEIPATDASGNILGTVRPSDWVMQVSASRAYESRWRYGGAIKYINSNYGIYRSNGIAFDASLNYTDTSNGLSVTIAAANMGFQLKEYSGTMKGDLPFDLRIGVTKRFSNAPFSLSLTAHHLHMFDIQYRDTVFNNDNGFENEKRGGFTFDKLLRHFIAAATVHLGDKVDVHLGYNYLQRKELSIGNSGNGLTGFSAGASLMLDKFSVRYARGYFQNNNAFNQFGLNVFLDKLVF